MIGRTHLAALAMLTATACGDDDTSGAPDVGPTDASGGETGLDAGPRDAEPPDVAPPPPPVDAGPPGCLDVVARDLDADLDADGRDGQIHAALAFANDTVWVVYSEPEAAGTGLFDVRARRFACDGSPSGASFAVQSTSDGNDVDPEIALGAGGALVAWTKDDGSGGTANLQIHARAFDLDGEPRSVEQRISTTRDGMPVPDNHLDARVIPLDDGFLLAGARALPDVMRFQAFVQALDVAGAARGDARDVLVEMQTSQGAPAIAARSAMDGWIAYERTEDGAADGQVVLARIDGGAPVPIALDLESTGAPSLALDRTDDARVWAAFGGEVLSGEVDVWLVDGSAPEATRANVRLGERRRLDHTPVVVSDERGGGAVAWYRNTSGIRNELWVARFASDGAAGLRAGTPVLVASDVPPYAPAITHVAGDVFVLAFSQGTSPAFRLRMRWIDLTAP